MWKQIYDEAVETINTFGGDILYFRGHSDESWRLIPGIARASTPYSSSQEQIMYYDFVTRAGKLLPESNSSWANLFAMQHHGLPTRLLDWSETFGVALYFALRTMKRDCNACVWIFDPFALNKLSTKSALLYNPSDLQHDYFECYIEGNSSIGGKVISLSPYRHNPRVFHQKTGFTIHDDLNKSIEEEYPECLKKISIPNEAKEEAIEFLKLAGINEFSLFPDLDGLARSLNNYKI